MVGTSDLTAAEKAADEPRGFSLLGEPLVDAAAVAAYMSCDRATVYRLAAMSALPSIEIAPRVLRFRPADVRAFVESRTRRALPRGRVQRLLGSPS